MYCATMFSTGSRCMVRKSNDRQLRTKVGYVSNQNPWVYDVKPARGNFTRADVVWGGWVDGWGWGVCIVLIVH